MSTGRKGYPSVSQAIKLVVYGPGHVIVVSHAHKYIRTLEELNRATLVLETNWK